LDRIRVDLAAAFRNKTGICAFIKRSSENEEQVSRKSAVRTSKKPRLSAELLFDVLSPALFVLGTRFLGLVAGSRVMPAKVSRRCGSWSIGCPARFVPAVSGGQRVEPRRLEPSFLASLAN
jgi:hypothetical protein